MGCDRQAPKSQPHVISPRPRVESCCGSDLVRWAPLEQKPAPSSVLCRFTSRSDSSRVDGQKVFVFCGCSLEDAPGALGGSQGEVSGCTRLYAGGSKPGMRTSPGRRREQAPARALLLKMEKCSLLEWMVCRIGVYASFGCISHRHLSQIPVASVCAECKENKQP